MNRDSSISKEIGYVQADFFFWPGLWFAHEKLREILEETAG
jgi:hypothetical protein